MDKRTDDGKQSHKCSVRSNDLQLPALLRNYDRPTNQPNGQQTDMRGHKEVTLDEIIHWLKGHWILEKGSRKELEYKVSNILVDKLEIIEKDKQFLHIWMF